MAGICYLLLVIRVLNEFWQRYINSENTSAGQENHKSIAMNNSCYRSLVSATVTISEFNINFEVKKYGIQHGLREGRNYSDL
jgi:hypothetical protein